ncbi:nuclear transport factor 2 family protein [Streptomyces poriferorum]|uniref:Nuclear transport factor 2 family protein n=1 Tax=Streptomyces poriferorum TaxID=2798799 RepID=A0ABY9INB8_9ACTN|nr:MULTISPECIES: nuclear transport factor 2 family protein [unclassified Streptomyces]MDP5314381.1 nuclear transport factor 2 family protein [Streptomyces sp. Alt4]WLQ50633.1 nuclear transport factor 2 family protein [Streptomyces sp. Alt1]WLQ56700.1 nuclear transport factor 2 family protein [Streptomyces sp. Alt2]WSI65435.1 nuclear transport factor 2 family protein [Streptomyces sp. NBC_01336]
MLQELTDIAAIEAAAVAYATALDTRDWETLGALFTDDACWEYSGSGERHCGPDAIVGRIRTGLERIDATHHLNGNHVAAVHGDEAEHTCYYQAQHVRHGLPDGEKFLGGGRYDDRLRRTPDGWRFTHRRITSIWSEGNPAVITS